MVRAMARLVDSNRLEMVRARARPEGMFLHEIAIDEIKDRLELVNRSFTRPAVVTGFPEIWQAALPDARIVPDTEILDLEPGGHDLVIHGLSLHWSNDPVTQVFQCAQALAPDGLFLAAAFAGQTLHELRAVLAEVEIEITGGLSPRVLPMGEIRSYGQMLQSVGLALPVVDSETKTVTYSDAIALMHDLRAMGEGNALAERASHTKRDYFARTAARYAETFGTEGRIPATFELIFLTGWAPHESQQKPLKPGSATARLADALGTKETKLSD